MSNNSTRLLPVRPRLDELEREAQEAAAAENIRLTYAQEAVAQSYGAESWERMVQSC